MPFVAYSGRRWHTAFTGTADCGHCLLTPPDADGQRDLIENDACPCHGAEETT